MPVCPTCRVALMMSADVGLTMDLPTFHMWLGSTSVMSPSQGWVNSDTHLVGNQSGIIHFSWAHLCT